LTAPALPPEVVNEVALLFAKRRQHAPTMDGAHNPNPGEIKAAQEAVEIVARALGGDGGPVVCGTHVIVTKRLKSDGDGVPPMGVYEVVDRTRSTTGHIVAKHGKVAWILAPGEFEEIAVPATRPAATGDTGEGDGALIGEAFGIIGHVVNHARRSTNIDGTRRRLGDDEACGRNWIALVDKCEALLATRAATGGPDAR